MNIALFSLILIILILSAAYLRLFKNYKNTKQDILKIYLAAKRLRYGDIHTKTGNLNDKKAEAVINRLFETIYDREIMIREYQNTLSSKNLSLEKILKQEQEMQQLKEDFAAALAHDMKVPVIAELNSIEYLLNGRFGNLNEQQINVLNLMLNSNKELKELIENMLEVYKTEQQGLKLELNNINLNDFLLSAAKETEPAAPDIEIQCILNKTEGIEIKADKFQLKRAVKNILQNALSFSPEKEKVIIETDYTDEEAAIIIKNKGAGISDKDLELIFNKCFCTNSKFRKAGTGLGLYISKQIMLAHGGSIKAKSEKNGCTEFYLTLKIKNGRNLR